MTPAPHDAVASSRRAAPVEGLGRSDSLPRSDSTGPATSLRLVLGRSLFPIVALGLILGTILWGPWVTLVLTFTWWAVVTRIG